jgi:hypothetical protein
VISQRERLQLNPFGTCAAAGAVALGLLGLFLGDDISLGMTNSLRGAAAPIAHLWGAMATIGGLMKLVGLYGGRTTIEVPGLWLMTGAYGFYCATVLIGLGRSGLVAGILAGAMTIGCLLKVRMIMARARAVPGPRSGGQG